jgi:hypothetical protein
MDFFNSNKACVKLPFETMIEIFLLHFRTLIMVRVELEK